MTERDAAATGLLRATGLFRALEGDALLAAARASRFVEVEEGAAIIRQGDPGDALFVVAEGRLGVLVSEGGGEPRPVAELGPGELFGELQAVSLGTAQATEEVAARRRPLPPPARRALWHLGPRRLRRDRALRLRVCARVAAWAQGAGPWLERTSL
jgi:CRP-like cAMP-binding protein